MAICAREDGLAWVFVLKTGNSLSHCRESRQHMGCQKISSRLLLNPKTQVAFPTTEVFLYTE